MRLAVTFLGLDLFSIDVSTASLVEDDCSRDLSGGTLSAYPLDSGPVDRYMGFTMGLGDGE